MKKRYVYVGNGCIQAKNRLITQNTLLRDDDGISQGEIDHFVKTGLLEEVPENILSTERPPTDPNKPAAQAPQKVATDQPQWPVNWGFTAEKLAGKSVADLNILIAEHAERIKQQRPPLFEAIEEAIAFLGQDLKS